MSGSNVRARRRGERKTWRNALAASLLFHLLVFVVSGRRSIPTPVSSSAGPNAGDVRPASGGMQAIRFRAPPPRPLPPPAIPVPVEIDIEPLDLDPEPDFDLAALLGDPGLPGPPGLEGDGAGNGGAGTEGGSVYVEPKPRGLTLPSDHKNLRTVTIWVFVDESGRVVADSIRLDPPTRDRKLNREILKRAAQWRFVPASRNGRPVAAWTSYTVEKGGGLAP